MADYLCILGRERALSAAEIEAIAPRWGARVTGWHITAMQLTTENELFPEALRQLGGTTKLVTVAGSIHQGGSILEDVAAHCTAAWVQGLFPSGRIEYGVSVYGASARDRKSIQQHFLKLKQELKQSGRPVRFVTSREDQLSTVTVVRQGLVKQGKEIVIVRGSESTIFGITRAVQDYQAYQQRDRGRPAADARSGMLPVKVAQGMLNLAQVERDDVLLDPFCGSGTILQEAALLGAQKIIGSDNSNKAVTDSQTNVRWLLKEFPELQTDIEVTKHDVREQSQRPTVIVTEPFLGKPLHGNESEKTLRHQIQELERLYTESFRQWARLLPSGGRVVMIWPEFFTNGESITLAIEDQVARLGFTLQPLLSEQNATAYNHGHQTMVSYGRPDSRLRRQIRKWVRQ